MLIKYFPKIVAFRRQYEQYGTAGQATDDIVCRMSFACWKTEATGT